VKLSAALIQPFLLLNSLITDLDFK